MACPSGGDSMHFTPAQHEAVHHLLVLDRASPGLSMEQQ